MKEYSRNPEDHSEQPIEWSLEGVRHFVEVYGKKEGELIDQPPPLRNFNELLEALGYTSAGLEPLVNTRLYANYHPKNQFGAYGAELHFIRLKNVNPGEALARIDLLTTQTVIEEGVEDISVAYEVICAPNGQEYFGLQKRHYREGWSWENNPPDKWVTDENELQALAELIQSAASATKADE